MNMEFQYIERGSPTKKIGELGPWNDIVYSIGL
jgi:hypothetical protein